MMTTTVAARYRFLFLWLMFGAKVGYGLAEEEDNNYQMIVGNIYTVNPDTPWVEAIGINKEGIIEVIGTRSEVETVLNEKIASSTNENNINHNNETITIVDFSSSSTDEADNNENNNLILPGFQDVHLHVMEGGINSNVLCYMEEYTYPEDIPYSLEGRNWNCELGDQGWYIASGIDINFIIDTVLEEGCRTPLQVLDEWFPTRPVLILDNLGHGAIANTIAFEQVGYDDPSIGHPPGGMILRDETSNDLLGIVLENAQQPFRNVAFPPTSTNEELVYEYFYKNTLYELNRNGITSISDAGGFWKQGQTDNTWNRAIQENVMTVRASNALYIYPNEPLSEQLPKLKQRYTNDQNSLLRFNQAKIYVDGILSLSTSALYESYTIDTNQYPWEVVEEEEWFGFEYFSNPEETLQDVSQQLHDAGFQLHYHVTGDRGTGLALDAIEALIIDGSDNNNNNRQYPYGPPRLTHCYLIDERDRNRFVSLGVVADFQLAPSSFNSEYRQSLVPMIGQDRVSQLLPAWEIYQTGAIVTLSSDWDADILSPLIKLETAISQGSFPNLETVIPLMTINAATLLQQDDRTGSIEVGKFADLVILDRNIFNVPTNEISKAKVVMTMLQGEVVYDGAEDSSASTILSSSYWSWWWKYCWQTSLFVVVVGWL